VTLFSFLAILWGLSGPLDFTVHGMNIHIPGYMVWVGAFGLCCRGYMGYVSRRSADFVKLNFDKQRFEANFRFSLVRPA